MSYIGRVVFTPKREEVVIGLCCLPQRIDRSRPPTFSSLSFPEIEVWWMSRHALRRYTEKLLSSCEIKRHES